MADDTDSKQAAAAALGDDAEAYVDNRVHRVGDDLDRLAGWCASATLGLDVATGAGHTASALREAGVDRVVATDAAPAMVDTATTTFDGLEGAVTDAEALPFREDTFDAVACRIAAHHFPDPGAFVDEVARVLEPGGTFAFEDNVAPDDDRLDEFLNTVERLRDPTHVRSHTVDEWLDRMEAAGLRVEETRVVTKTINYDDWVAQLDTPESNRDRLRELFADPPSGADDLFEIERENGTVASFANLKLLVRATKPGA